MKYFLSKKLSIIFLFLVFLIPNLTQATTIRPGTDDFLRQKLGYTDEMLSQNLIVEKRQRFNLAQGEIKINDPVGDVLNRFGDTSSLQIPWGDLINTELKLNKKNQTWDFIIKTSAHIPKKIVQDKAQFFIYVDSDNDLTNNAKEGIGADTDQEYSLQYNQKHGWYTDFKWYNAPADFWGINKETQSTFKIENDQVTYSIPWQELPQDLNFHWRVLLAIQKGQETQIDALPMIGFPAPLDNNSYPPQPDLQQITDHNHQKITDYLVIGFLFLSAGLFVYFRKK